MNAVNFQLIAADLELEAGRSGAAVRSNGENALPWQLLGLVMKKALDKH